MASVQNCSLLQKDSTVEPNGLHARAYWIAPNASCPDMVGWRSWRADRVGRDRERICRIATRRDAMPKKQLATPAMPGSRAYDDCVMGPGGGAQHDAAQAYIRNQANAAGP